ncbi:hypothetical protein EON82_19105 [bacterium]|nr:MAG: hypothetical protein EON82_19105 [bacterium]
MLGYDLDGAGHHSGLFPFGSWVRATFERPDPVLSFVGPFREVKTGAGPGKATGQVAAGWRDNSTWGPVEVLYGATSARDGNAQRVRILSIGERGAGQLIQSVKLERGMLYRASATLRSEDSLEVTLQLRQPGPPYLPIAQTTARLGKEWRTVSAQGVCDAENCPDAEALFILRAVKPGSFDVSDASLSKVISPRP